MKNSLRKSVFVVLASSLLACSCFAADDDPGDPNIFSHKDKDGNPKVKEKKTPKQLVSSSVKASETPIPRVWIGLTGSYTPLNLIKANTVGLTNSNSDSTSAKSAQGLAGGGLTVNARVLHNYWISIGAIYRYNGYDWNYALNPLTDGNFDTFTERSRARMIDFPLLVKYSGRKYNISKRTFYELGAVYRDVLSRKTTTNWADFNSTSLGPIPPGLPLPSGGAYPSPIVAYKPHTFGAVAGVGLAAKDDFGIIVSPEVRYTRWMGDTFSNDVLHSQKNQLEITVSFGF